MRMTASLCSLFVLVSACTYPNDAYAGLYQAPARFVGQTVEVCGYMIDSSNILWTADRTDTKRRGGFSIDGKGPLNRLYRGHLCVEGEITYVGCGNGTVVCTDAAYEYGIRVRRVISYG